MKTFSEFVSEAKRTTDIGKHTGEPVPYKNLSPKNRYKLEQERRENLKKRPGDPPGDSRLIQAFRQRAKDEGNFAEEFKDLTPEKEQRVKNRVGELARNVQLKGARVKELRNKPLAKFRPKIKKEIEANVKSAKKDAKLVSNASDALIRASIDRSAKIKKQIEDKKRGL